MARTNGSFRPGFESRIKKAFGDEKAKPLLDRLAVLN
jgi:hypothetical protein